MTYFSSKLVDEPYRTLLRFKLIEDRSELENAESHQIIQWVRYLNAENRLRHVLNDLHNHYVLSLNPAEKSKFTDLLVVLDQLENLMGVANWLLVRRAGLPHAGTTLGVIKDRKILLARRSDDEENPISDPGGWELTCGGGLSSLDSNFIKMHAIEELFEEIFNVENLDAEKLQRYAQKLTFIGTHWVEGDDGHYGHVNTKNYIHLIDWQDDFPEINPNRNEVGEVFWANWDDFQRISKTAGPLSDLKYLTADSLRKIRQRLTA